MKAQTKMQLATKATKMTKSKMRSFSSTFGMFWQEAEVKWAMCSVFVTMDVQMLDVQVLDVCESQTLCWETEILLRPRGWMENLYTTMCTKTILCNFPHSPYKDIKLLSKSTPFIPASTIRPTRLFIEYEYTTYEGLPIYVCVIMKVYNEFKLAFGRHVMGWKP